MAHLKLSMLLARTNDLLSSLNIYEQAALTNLDVFLSGPPVVAVIGNRARGLKELIEGLRGEFPLVIFRNDLKDVELEQSLIDALLLATPCEAALSGGELATVRALRQLKRPVAVIVTDAEQLGDNRIAGQDEIESLRLQPLLSNENVTWCFRAAGESIEPSLNLARQLVIFATNNLHAKPTADSLIRLLVNAETTFDERCRVRDQEREILRQAEAQGPLDLAQFSEAERIERLRVGDRIRTSFERVLAAAEATGASLESWMRAGGNGDARDAISTIEEAWDSFCVELKEAPRASIEAVQNEGSRLGNRLSESAVRLGAGIPPALFDNDIQKIPQEIEDAGKRLAETSIRDLIDGSIKIMKDAEKKVEDTSQSKNPINPSEKSLNRDGINMVKAVLAVNEPLAAIVYATGKGVVATYKQVVQVIPPPLTATELVRCQLVQGIRSRVELRLKEYIEKIEVWLRAQSIPRSEAWNKTRIEAIASIRAVVSDRHSWSSALGELQILRQEVEEFRRTLS